MRRTLVLLLCAAASSALAQVPGPPMGGTNLPIGPPSGSIENFTGVWDLTWQGPIDSGCPCRGSLTITLNDFGELRGVWKMKGPPATLSGQVDYDRNVWAGRFEQSDDADFPMHGHFRIETRDERLLTGSYQPEGTAIPYTWTATR